MGFETVFKGDECVNQFMTWLLDGTHQGAIVIPHNLRGYHGFLICEQFYKECLSQTDPEWCQDYVHGP